jgi:hypothetical protein
MQQFTCQNPENKRTPAPLASGKIFHPANIPKIRLTKFGHTLTM